MRNRTNTKFLACHRVLSECCFPDVGQRIRMSLMQMLGIRNVWDLGGVFVLDLLVEHPYFENLKSETF